MRALAAPQRFLSAISLMLAALCFPVRSAAIEIVSGNGQAAPAGSTFPLPWTVRVNAFEQVRFTAFPGDAWPSASFDGQWSLWVAANQDGIATSPPLMANLVPGLGHGMADAASGGSVEFDFVNLAPYRTAVEHFPMEHTVALGYETVIPFSGHVLGATGDRVAGVPFVFSTDPDCGAFAGQASFAGLTGADGAAVSPPFTGVGRSPECPWSLAFEGAEPVIARTMHVYAIAALGLYASPASVETITGERFMVVITFYAEGQPVFSLPPGFGIDIVTEHTGATAVLDGEPLYVVSSNSVNAGFIANGKPGTYDIVVRSAGPATLTVPVRQRKPRGK